MLQSAASAAGPRYGSSRCSLMMTEFDSFTELLLPSVSFIVYSSKRQTSWPTCTASILVHTQQVDPHFPRPFPPLPPAPLTAVPILSPTSSCDSAPAAPIKHAPPQPPPSQASSTSSSSPPLPQPKRKREPPPPLNENADWDAWDGDADVRLVELKTDTRLRPNWNYVARGVGFSIEQCKARWEELQEPQHQQKAVNTPPSPTPTSPANTPPASPVPSPPLAAALPPPAPPSAPFSYTPTTPPSTAPAAAAMADAMPATISEDSHPEPAAAAIVAPAAADAAPANISEDTPLDPAAADIGSYFG